MTAIIGDLGVMSGRMSPLTPESAVVRELMEAQGLTGNTVPIMMCLTVTALVVAVLVYIYYKGWKVAPHTAHEDVLPKFSKISGSPSRDLPLSRSAPCSSPGMSDLPVLLSAPSLSFSDAVMKRLHSK